jgi:hypothetical protein
MCEGRAFDRPVSRDRQLEGLVGKAFLKAYVAAFLPDDDPAVPLQRPDDRQEVE